MTRRGSDPVVRTQTGHVGPEEVDQQSVRLAAHGVHGVRLGGHRALDDVLLGGRVLDPAFQEPRHVAVRRLNVLIATNERGQSVMLPVRDGVTPARRR